MEETPPAEAPAPAPPPQSWTMTEHGPVPTPQMVRAIQADVRPQRAQAAWEDDPANRPAPGKRRRDGNPLKKRGRDEREVEELEAKLREMKALRERVVEHIAVCKKYGYCGYAKEDDDPAPDTPQPDMPPPPPPPQAAPRAPPRRARGINSRRISQIRRTYQTNFSSPTTTLVCRRKRARCWPPSTMRVRRA